MNLVNVLIHTCEWFDIGVAVVNCVDVAVQSFGMLHSMYEVEVEFVPSGVAIIKSKLILQAQNLQEPQPYLQPNRKQGLIIRKKFFV